MGEWLRRFGRGVVMVGVGGYCDGRMVVMVGSNGCNLGWAVALFEAKGHKRWCKWMKSLP